MNFPDDYLIPNIEPYHVEKAGIIYCGDCRDILPHLPKGLLIVTDPPFNLKYHYNEYKDNYKEEEYYAMLREVINIPAVIVHYPEIIFKISWVMEEIPNKCVAWVYNANTPREHRMIAWFGCKPNFSLVKQPYKNIKDKRIFNRINSGSSGANLYDWWHINQVKNISSDKTIHPCQMPLTVLKNIIGITVYDIILDPFLGSGTTAVAAKELGRQFIGIEISEEYCAIAVKRLKQCNPLPFTENPKPKTENRRLYEPDNHSL